jgi:hypothetical protein
MVQKSKSGSAGKRSHLEFLVQILERGLLPRNDPPIRPIPTSHPKPFCGPALQPSAPCSFLGFHSCPLSSTPVADAPSPTLPSFPDTLPRLQVDKAASPDESVKSTAESSHSLSHAAVNSNSLVVELDHAPNSQPHRAIVPRQLNNRPPLQLSASTAPPSTRRILSSSVGLTPRLGTVPSRSNLVSQGHSPTSTQPAGPSTASSGRAAIPLRVLLSSHRTLASAASRGPKQRVPCLAGGRIAAQLYGPQTTTTIAMIAGKGSC